MSALQLTFDFEDKLKKFIEDNCNYNFSIIVTAKNGSIYIEDYEEAEEVNSDIVEDTAEELQSIIYKLQSKLEEAEDKVHYYEEKLLDCEAN